MTGIIFFDPYGIICKSGLAETIIVVYDSLTATKFLCVEVKGRFWKREIINFQKIFTPPILRYEDIFRYEQPRLISPLL